MMDKKAVKQLLIEAFPDSEIEVDSDGYHYHLLLVSERFNGMGKVARQQAVYRVLAPSISSGKLHALSMKTHTFFEWKEKKGG